MRQSVLLLDDSDVNRAVYRGALSVMPNLDIAEFESGEPALEAMAGRRFDVVILDYHMPGMDGLEFMERAQPYLGDDTSVVMVTGDKDVGVRHRALELSAADFLTKPIDRLEFQTRVRNMLALVRSRRQLADRATWLREEIDRATAALRDQEMETIERLTRAAEFRDSVTGMHVVRVGEMCAALARTIGLPDEECTRLRLAAPMHDIGKVATPDHILLKPGPLTPEEFEIMKQHAAAGYGILKGSRSPMLQQAAEIALTHHERWDGTGYPNRLSGAQIPLSGRLCSIVDVFDALTSIRPYKKAWTIEDALSELTAKSGTAFDPDVVTLFHDSIPAIVEIKRRFTDNAQAA